MLFYKPVGDQWSFSHPTIFCTLYIPFSVLFSFRNMWKAFSVTLVVMVTTPLSSATPWAVCRVCVTSAALCQGLYVICGPDNARAERGWRALAAPTVPTTTTTGVYTSRVRE